MNNVSLVSLDKSRKQVIINLILAFVQIPFGIVFLIVTASLKVLLEGGAPSGALGTVIGILFLSLLMGGVGVATLVLFIINIITAEKISRMENNNNTPFILLIVGIFVGIVGIVGLFLLKNQIERVIVSQTSNKNSQNENDQNDKPLA